VHQFLSLHFYLITKWQGKMEAIMTPLKDFCERFNTGKGYRYSLIQRTYEKFSEKIEAQPDFRLSQILLELLNSK
jgi:hypothetical protein